MGMWLATVLLLAVLIAVPFAINVPIKKAVARRSDSSAIDMDEGSTRNGVKLTIWAVINTLLWLFTGVFGLVNAVRCLRTADIRQKRKYAYTAKLWNIVGSVVAAVILLANLTFNS